MARHCETCTCGLTEVQWSDRSGYVNLKDPENVADMVIGCSLDHCYDRTEDGVPYGIPTEMRTKLAPIVAKHLLIAEPDWKNKTVFGMEESRRNAFRSDLIAALCSLKS